MIPRFSRLPRSRGRVLVTQDIQTVTRFAFERVDADLPMPGVIEIVPGAGLGATIELVARRMR
jgi:hypothetical protein